MVRVGSAVRTLILCGLALTTLAFAKTNQNKTIVTHPYGFAISQPIADMPIDYSAFESHVTPEPRPLPLRQRAVPGPVGQEDAVTQKQVLPQVAATQGIRFDGISSPGYAPSDSNMAIGPTKIVETVNVQFAVYDKNGTTLAGPTNILNIFAALGGICSSTYGDPVVLYDRQADRWLLSIIGTSGSVQAECVAVSKTNDPAGAYYLYGYSFGANLNDYPKLSTWATASNSAYLATYNIFINFQAFGGADLCGFDRTKMLAGDKTAAQLCQMTPSAEGGYLPSDMDGPSVPADGTPGLYINWQNNNPGQLYLRKLTLNFAAATATLSAPTVISTANTALACGNGGQCVPQTGTTQTLDTLGDRMMYRFAVRHFADHDRAVFDHAVQNGTQVALRWYELYDPAGSVTLNQQGTFAPDTTYRWMGSMAEDQNGNIGLGYSASSSSLHPAVRFTGRVPSDPSGTLESEASIIEPAGSQTTGLARWGDYTAMQVDPSDDCTFWYVDQYEQTSGTFNWHTSISSFAFPGCSGGSPGFTLGASPASVSVAQSGTATSTITVTPLNGFNSTVTLSASGLPSGVTAGFSPNPTSTTSTLTFTASSTAALGTSTVTVTGTSGSITQTTTLSLTVTQTGGGPTVTVSPTSLTFPARKVGTTAAGQVVTLTNTGTSVLNIGSIVTSGDFGLGTTFKPCGATLAAGKNCKIKVTFTPTQTGTRTGQLTITDNAPSSPQTVPLTGTGK